MLQTKLEVGAPNDKYEQEADRVEDQVMRMADPQRADLLDLAGEAAPDGIQRLCAECGEEVRGQAIEDEEEELQMKRASGAMPEIGAGPHAQISGLRAGGQPLSPSLRAFFEPRFGHDFSQVRLHQASQASEAARAITVSNTSLGTALRRLSLPRTLTTRATDDSRAGPSAGHDFAKVPVTAKSEISRPFAVAQGVPAPVWGPSMPGSIPTAWPDVPVEPAPAAEGFASVSLPANIRGWQSPYGTPDRIPPRTPTAVDVGVEGWSTPMLSITLTIEGAGGGNGTVTIDGGATAEVSTSTTVELRGQDQTAVGQAEGLRLAAYQGPTRLSASEPFSVAAWPIGARFLFVGIMSPEIIEGIPIWGAKYALEPISDSGALIDCNETQITENVLVHSESGVWVGALHRQSDFLPTRVQMDRHGIGHQTAAEMIKFIKAAGVAESSTVYHQFYRFACARSGIPADRNGGPKVPNSGFRINHATSKADGKYFIHAQKEGFANNGVAAGTVDQTDVKKAEIKD